MPNAKQNALTLVLALVALIALIAAYFAPIWWVSLTAPTTEGRLPRRHPHPLPLRRRL